MLVNSQIFTYRKTQNIIVEAHRLSNAEFLNNLQQTCASLRANAKQKLLISKTNMDNTQTIANAIRQNNKPEYLSARYPFIQDGCDLVFDGYDFSDTDFSKFPAGFFVFKNCTLSRAKGLYSQPITFNNVIATGIDFRECNAILLASDSDFRGMIYDNNTFLARPEVGDAGCSQFINCKFDQSTREYFAKQGAIFTN